MSGQFVSAKYLPYFAEKENGIWLRICAGVDPRAERSPPACRHGGVLEWRRETSLWRSCPGRTSSAPRSEANAGAAPGGRACDERHRPAGAELGKAQGRHRGDWICLCRGPAGALMGGYCPPASRLGGAGRAEEYPPAAGVEGRPDHAAHGCRPLRHSKIRVSCSKCPRRLPGQIQIQVFVLLCGVLPRQVLIHIPLHHLVPAPAVFKIKRLGSVNGIQ